MIKIEHVVCPSDDQMMFVIEGMRNAFNSWDKSDSAMHSCTDTGVETGFHLGEVDNALMCKLARLGSDERKFMRQMPIMMRITAPLYWWKEFDTYKVGTVTNSCSTMHKIYEKEFTLDDFSTEHLDDVSLDTFNYIIAQIEYDRKLYLKTKVKPMKDESKRAELMKKYWWQMIQLLPSSYNQKRTVMMNYEVLANIYESRKNHPLDEWSVGFMEWIESLPYSELICGPEFLRKGFNIKKGEDNNEV